MSCMCCHSFQKHIYFIQELYHFFILWNAWGFSFLNLQRPYQFLTGFFILFGSYHILFVGFIHYFQSIGAWVLHKAEVYFHENNNLMKENFTNSITFLKQKYHTYISKLIVNFFATRSFFPIRWLCKDCLVSHIWAKWQPFKVEISRSYCKLFKRFLLNFVSDKECLT